MGDFVIFVRTLQGQCFSLEGDMGTTTFAEYGAQLAERAPDTAGAVFLLAGGRCLPEKTACDYGIQSEATLHAIVLPAGRKVPEYVPDWSRIPRTEAKEELHYDDEELNEEATAAEPRS